MQLRHIWFLMLKDLRLFVTDRNALLFFILFPFFFVVLFNFVLGGANVTTDPRLTMHVVTREPAGISLDIIKAIETPEGQELPPGQPKIVWDKDYDAALQEVKDGKLPGFLAFPDDFTRGVTVGYGARLEVVIDPEETFVRAALEGLGQEIASRIGGERVASQATMGLLVQQAGSGGADLSRIGEDIQRALTAQGGASAESLITFETQKVGDITRENPSNYVIPGYLVMFVFFGAALGAETIVRERKNGTLERLLASSARKESILGGIYAGIAAKGLIQILVFWVIGILVFHLDLGASPGGAIVLSILMALMSAAFAAMLATLARTERSAGSIAVITSLVLAPLGGCWWPLFITPHWMQFLAKLTPHGWATTGFNKLMVFGGDFSSALPEMAALLVFGAIFIGIAVRRFQTSSV